MNSGALPFKTYGNPPVRLIRACLKFQDRVREVGAETATGDGYWIYLKDGWISSRTECSTVHEWTIEDAINDLKNSLKK